MTSNIPATTRYPLLSQRRAAISEAYYCTYAIHMACSSSAEALCNIRPGLISGDMVTGSLHGGVAEEIMGSGILVWNSQW